MFFALEFPTAQGDFFGMLLLASQVGFTDGVLVLGFKPFETPDIKKSILFFFTGFFVSSSDESSDEELELSSILVTVFAGITFLTGAFEGSDVFELSFFDDWATGASSSSEESLLLSEVPELDEATDFPTTGFLVGTAVVVVVLVPLLACGHLLDVVNGGFFFTTSSSLDDSDDDSDDDDCGGARTAS